MLIDLLASLTASPRGCKIPKKETLKGPKRRPTILKILRSNRVKKATETKAGMISMTNFNEIKKIFKRS